VNTSPPLITTSDELANKLVGKVSKTRNTSGGQAIESGLCYPFQGGWEVPAVRSTVHILDIHLGLVHPKVLFWVCAPIIQFHGTHHNFLEPGDRPHPSGYSVHLDGSLYVPFRLNYLGAPSRETSPQGAAGMAGTMVVRTLRGGTAGTLPN